MGVIDKVSVGGTTYDVQDSAATAEITAIEGASADALSVKAYGVQFTGTDNGVTIAKSGRRVTLNGTKAAGYNRCVCVTNGLVGANNDNPTVNHVNPDAVLYAGRTYVISARVISGTYTQGSNNCGVWYFTYNGTTVSSPSINTSLSAIISSGGFETKRITPSTNITIGFGFFFREGCSFSNLVIEFGVQDITETTYTYTSATPSITAAAGVRYICSASYVTSLSFTPSASGICSVRFVSGTTPTVLTLPNTVVMPEWWTGVEASRTYEISIEDGIYGAVTSWA